MDISSINSSVAPITPPTEPSSLRAAGADARSLIQAVKAVDATGLFGQENELTFLFDRTTHRPVVRIVNRKSGEIIQQIPAEYVLRLAEENKRR